MIIFKVKNAALSQQFRKNVYKRNRKSDYKRFKIFNDHFVGKQSKQTILN